MKLGPRTGSTGWKVQNNLLSYGGIPKFGYFLFHRLVTLIIIIIIIKPHIYPTKYCSEFQKNYIFFLKQNQRSKRPTNKAAAAAVGLLNPIQFKVASGLPVSNWMVNGPFMRNSWCFNQLKWTGAKISKAKVKICQTFLPISLNRSSYSIDGKLLGLCFWKNR